MDDHFRQSALPQTNQRSGKATKDELLAKNPVRRAIRASTRAPLTLVPHRNNIFIDIPLLDAMIGSITTHCFHLFENVSLVLFIADKAILH
jgi:hypothetical protein